MAVAIGETEALTVQAAPEHLPVHWYKFCALAKVWARNSQLATAGAQLRSIAPPPLDSSPTGRVAGGTQVVAAETAAGPAVD